MTKRQIIMKVSRHTGVSYKDTELIIESFLAILKAEWLAGVKVSIQEFGTFLLKDFKAKKGRDIRRNKTVLIPAGKRPVFKVSSQLKKQSNDRF